jgi:hypothetical protein
LRINTKAAVLITVFCLLMGYASVPMALGAGYDDLDTAIRELSDYLNRRIPHGNKVVFLNVKSDWPEFSEYIISSLIENAVNDEVVTVVDRQQLDLIRSELNFQWSGEVSDASAQEIGQMLGAQTIVSGLVTEVGSEYRIQVRAISVQTAAVLGLSSQNIDSKGPLVSALTTAPAAAAAREAKKEEDARKRQAATENFLKKSAFIISGWMGYMFGNNSSMYSGGADVEINFFRYFGLQIGFEIFQDEDKPQGEANPIITQTILQIPVLARITLSWADLFYISGYGGIGMNLFPFGSNDAAIQSPSKLSLVAGGDFGAYMQELAVFVGYQFNRDFSETAYSYKNNNFSYLGQRSMITFGMRYSMPFRKK